MYYIYFSRHYDVMIGHEGNLYIYPHISDSYLKITHVSDWSNIDLDRLNQMFALIKDSKVISYTHVNVS